MNKLLLIPLLGCAQTPARSTTPTAVGPAISTLQWYVGDWTCDGTDEKGGVSPDYPKLDIKVAPAFANWISIDVWDHGKRTTGEFLGADEKGKFHHVWTSEDGVSGSLTAQGWQGDTLTLEDDHPLPDKVRSRMILRKVDSDHYVHVYEENPGSGFTPIFTKTCRRVAS